MPKTPKAEIPAGRLSAHAFTVRDLQTLIGARSGPCVSIYEPAHARPDGSREDRVRWKNLLTEAREKLEAASHPRTARRILAPLETLDDGEFRHGDRGGLAAFASEGFVAVFRVPVELAERVVVADSFHVRPLLRLLQSTNRYHVLALSRNSVRFFEGSNGSLVERKVPSMPQKLEDVASPVAPREGSSTRSAGRGASVHGGSSEPRGEKEDLARFHRAVDAAVSAFLQDDHSPLVLVGVARSIASYRSVARHPGIAAAHVEGSFDRGTAEELRTRCEPVVEAIGTASRAAVRDEYHKLVGSFRATDDLRLVAKTVVTGRVRRLLLARGKITPGVLDATTGDVVKRSKRETSLGDDLGDDLAEAVLLRGGQVLVLEPGEMPTDQPIAAILRW